MTKSPYQTCPDADKPMGRPLDRSKTVRIEDGDPLVALQLRDGSQVLVFGDYGTITRRLSLAGQEDLWLSFHGYEPKAGLWVPVALRSQDIVRVTYGDVVRVTADPVGKLATLLGKDKSEVTWQDAKDNEAKPSRGILPSPRFHKRHDAGLRGAAAYAAENTRSIAEGFAKNHEKQIDVV